MKIFIYLVSILLIGCSNPSSKETHSKNNRVKSQEYEKYCTNDKPRVEILNLASQGDVKQQLLLAMIYDAGHCQVADLKLAESWYAKSANQDYVPAQASLGAFYLSPTYHQHYKSFNIEKANYWLDRAIDQNSSQAMLYKSALYCDNTYNLENASECRYWLQKSSEAGNKQAIEILSNLNK